LIKVLITGAFSTGNTTLIERLELSVKPRHSVAVVPDVARQCPFPLNREQGVDGTLWLIAKQLFNELEISRSRPDILLCDRGVPDILAHLEEVRQRAAAGVLAELMKPFLVEWCKSYDLVFASKIDRSLTVESDSYRLADNNFRAEMERLSDTVLAEILPNAIPLVSTPEGRVKQVVNLVKLKLKH
jgi:hypothetical protein